jgi:hypothetical protein
MMFGVSMGFMSVLYRSVARMCRWSPVDSGFDMVMAKVRHVNVMTVKPDVADMSSMPRVAKVRSTSSLQKQRNQRGYERQIENKVPPLEQINQRHSVLPFFAKISGIFNWERTAQ